MSAKPSRSVLYVDSSVLVTLALNDTQIAPKAWALLRRFDEVVTSELSVAECQSGVTMQVDRSRASGQAAFVDQNLNRVLGGLELISVNSLVLGHARALLKRYRVSVGLRGMDAIHLATANLIQQMGTSHSSEFQMQYVTADKRQHEAFSCEGFVGTYLSH